MAWVDNPCKVLLSGVHVQDEFPLVNREQEFLDDDRAGDNSDRQIIIEERELDDMIT